MENSINYYIFWLLATLAFLLETSFFPNILPESFSIKLLVILIIAMGILVSSEDFIYSSFLIGFFADIYTSVHFGIFMLSFLFLSFSVCILKWKIMKEENLFRMSAVIVASIISYDLFYILVLNLFFLNSSYSFDYNFILSKFIFDSVITLVLVFPAKYFISIKN